MILVDSRIGSVELLPHIKRLGVPTEKASLPFGDIAFEGQGREGTIAVGVERKTLHDMLNCIDDARYNGHQRLGMAEYYQVNFLLIEGLWKPHDPHGTLMEGFKGGTSWAECRYRSSRVMYAKLRRYLFSVSLSGVHVLYTRDLVQTAFDICECWHYFQKPWRSHTSLLEMQKLNLPTLNGKPSLVRKWAADIDGIGVKHSQDAEQLFRKPVALANSEETDWLRIPGIGVKSAQSIVRQIMGVR